MNRVLFHRNGVYFVHAIRSHKYYIVNKKKMWKKAFSVDDYMEAVDFFDDMAFENQ